MGLRNDVRIVYYSPFQFQENRVQSFLTVVFAVYFFERCCHCLRLDSIFHFLSPVVGLKSIL